MWRFLLSDSTTSTWYEISVAITTTDWGETMLSDESFFFTVTESSSPYSLLLAKASFGSISFTWSNKILCPTSACTQTRSTAVESYDKSLIYSFPGYGNPSYNLFISFNSTSGSVFGSRFILSPSGGGYYKSAALSDYVVIIFIKKFDLF